MDDAIENDAKLQGRGNFDVLLSRCSLSSIYHLQIRLSKDDEIQRWKPITALIHQVGLNFMKARLGTMTVKKTTSSVSISTSTKETKSSCTSEMK